MCAVQFFFNLSFLLFQNHAHRKFSLLAFLQVDHHCCDLLIHIQRCVTSPLKSFKILTNNEESCKIPCYVLEKPYPVSGASIFSRYVRKEKETLLARLRNKPTTNFNHQEISLVLWHELVSVFTHQFPQLEPVLSVPLHVSLFSLPAKHKGKQKQLNAVRYSGLL